MKYKHVMLLLMVILLTTGCEKDPAAPEEIEKLLSDCFPSAIGNKWTFSYHFYSFYSGGATDTLITGTLEWTVTHIDSSDTMMTYNIREILQGQKIIKRLSISPIPDTTFFGPDTASFALLENSEHYLSLQPRLFHSRIGFEDLVVKTTYLAMEDSVLVRIPEKPCELVIFVKGTGIVLWTWDRCGHTGPHESILLKESVIENF